MLLRAGAAGLLLCMSASPVVAASAAGQARVAVVTPLSLVNIGDLSFGMILPSATAGTVTVDAVTENRTKTGGVTLIGTARSAGKFVGLTAATSHLKIDIPQGPITIKCDSNGATMTVSDFQLNGDKNDWVSADTAFQIQIGARLSVAANQAPGFYHGDYSVTVNYR
jgi:Domain of unknown function (DUF4402)